MTEAQASPTETALARQIKAQILADGPMPIDAFMRIALTDPTHGYYTTKTPIGGRAGGRGTAGDFITAPEISQMFGEMIGVWAADFWQRSGAAETLHLVELGPGRGVLMQDALRAAQVLPDFIAAARVHFVEVSPTLRDAQRERVAAAQWHTSMDALMAALSDGPAIFIANEFFDALPIRQFARAPVTRNKEGGEVELCIACENDELVFTPADATNIREICPAADAAMAAIAQRLAAHGGAALIIDYGYAQGELGDTLQAIHAHNHCHPLAHIGAADLTAHVNFARLSTVAQDHGARAFPVTTQGSFLHAMGIDARAASLVRAHATKASEILRARDRLVAPDQMGRLFKVLCVVGETDTLPAAIEPTAMEAGA